MFDVRKVEPPAWRRYSREPDVLRGIVINHSREIERARRFISWAVAEQVAINNFLAGVES